MKDVLKIFDFWIVAILLCVLAALLWHHRRTLGKWAFPEARFSAIALLVLVVAGLLLRLLWVPHTHYVFDDELFHIDIAKNMQQEQRFFIRGSDYLPEGEFEILPQWMPVFHFMLSIVFRLFGSNSRVVFLFNSVIGGLSVALFFGLGKALFRRDSTALVLAGFLSFYPLHLKFSGSGNLEPLSLFFMAFTLLIVIVHKRAPGLGISILAVVVGTLAAMTRIENAIIATFAFLLVARDVPRNQNTARKLFLLSSGVLATIVYGQVLVSYELYAYWRHAVPERDILSGLKFLFLNPLNPVILPVLATGGAIVLWRKNRRMALTLMACWFLYLIAYMVVHRLDINRSDFHRYNLNMSLFELTLAAAMLDYLICKRNRWTKILIMVSMTFFIYGTIASISMIKKHYWPSKIAEFEWLRKASAQVSRDALICTEAPIFVRSVTGLPTIPPSLLSHVKTATDTTLLYYRAPQWKRNRQVDWEAQMATYYRFEPVVETQIEGNTIGFYLMLDARSPTN